MASIEEVQEGVLGANQRAGDALGAVHQAHESMRTALSLLVHATAGSPQADVSRAIGLFSQAVSGLDEIRQQIAGGISESENVVARL